MKILFKHRQSHLKLKQAVFAYKRCFSSQNVDDDFLMNLVPDFKQTGNKQQDQDMDMD